MSVNPRPEHFVPMSPQSIDALVPAVEQTMDALLSDLGSGLAVRMCKEHLATGGKRLRARLALQACAALGGEAEEAVAWAAACELIHNASLVHDDLQDGDRVRRGVEALWARHGAEQAINAGDLMLMLPTLALQALPVAPALRWDLARLVASHGARTAIGQSEEMALRANQRVDVDAYLEAARGKTAGLFGMPIEGAARLSGRSTEAARSLARPFEDLGLVYQLVDDVVDLYGDKGRDTPGADVREGKVSALVALHLALHPEDRLWLLGILRTPRERTTDAVVQDVIARFREGGALEGVLERIESLAEGVDRDALAAEPALYAVAEALRARILKPLGGLRVGSRV